VSDPSFLFPGVFRNVWYTALSRIVLVSRALLSPQPITANRKVCKGPALVSPGTPTHRCAFYASSFAHLLQEVPTAVEVVEFTPIVAFTNCRRKFNHALGIELNGVCLRNKANREEVWAALLPG
jgi:hypothetical protein